MARLWRGEEQNPADPVRHLCDAADQRRLADHVALLLVADAATRSVAVVPGVNFVATVWNELAVPEFSTEVLALMGLSGGTYVGFKLTEKPK